MTSSFPKALLGAAALAIAAATPGHALTITADTTGTGMSASSINIINSAIAFYQTTFADPINVDIRFYNSASGLGSTTFFLSTTPYSTFHAQLAADATSANDATALANTPLNGGNNPVNGTASMYIKNANARALGYSVAPNAFNAGNTSTVQCQGYTGDACIGLNLGATNDTILGTPTGYSLISVVEHEMDEALGLGSSLGLSLANPSPEDLFRFVSAGVRSYATNACTSPPQAFFSFNGGNSLVNEFNNCNNGADYGDWITHNPTQVQDAITNNSGLPFLTLASTEVAALDVIGYTLATPEPASLALLSTGLLGTLLIRRRSVARGLKQGK